MAEKSIVWRLVRDAAEDAVDLRLEAHVEHPVGLVEDEDADVGERDGAPLDQVEEPAGRRDEDVSVAGLLDLRPDRSAAVDRLDAQALGLGERAQVGSDLERELAGRAEDERARPGVRAGGALDERQAEGECLAGARRRLGENVETCERVRQDAGLDCKGMGDAGGFRAP